MKRILTFALLLCASWLLADTIATWPLTANGNASTVTSHVSAGNFAGGNGLSTVTYGATGAYASQWSIADLDLTDYFEITLTPAVSYRLHITDLNFGERRSGTGIRDYQVCCSTNGFTSFSTLAQVNVPDDTNERTGNLTGLTLTVEPGQTISFRWYGYNAEATGGTWRINDNTLTVLGTVELITGGTPLADFSGSPTSGSAPLSVNFADATIGGTPPYTYDWNFGDGSTHSTATNPSHSYTDVGNYTVSLTITDDNDAVDTEQKSNYITVVSGGGGNHYYDAMAGLTGQELFNALHNLIDTNTNNDYTASRTLMFGTLDNVNDSVRCVYTGQDFYVIPGTIPDANVLNCEHTYPQSYLGSTEFNVKKADLFHLFPVDNNVNSSRGNLPFGVVVHQTTSYPSAHGYISKRGTDANGTTVFEPADQHKGDCARAMLYMAVRYDLPTSFGGVDMLNTLLAWNTTDPVSAKEIARNDATYTYQTNRNPFIDHPEYISYIWGGGTTYTTLSFSPGSAEVNEDAGTVTLHITIANPSVSAATTATVALEDGTSDDIGGFTPVNLTFTAGSASTQTVTVPITDDTLLEGTETLVFGLENVAGGNNAMTGAYAHFSLTIDDNDMPTPVVDAPSNVTATGFTASWSICPGATGYEFDLASDPDFGSLVDGYNALVVNGTTLDIAALISGHTYYCRVRAQYGDIIGYDSNTVTVTTTVNSNAASDLIISEYVEGSSFNKAIELYNGTGSPLDLANYSLRKQVNGAGDFTNDMPLHGILANNETYVIVNGSTTNTTLIALADTLTAAYVMSYNGNDAIALYHSNTQTEVVGIVGQTASWGADMTLVRKDTVLSPRTDFTFDEWDQYPSDTFTYLGHHTMTFPNPVTPINLTIAVTGNDVVLHWTPGSSRSVYKIYRSATLSVSDWGAPIGTTADTTYTDVDAGAANRYYYRVTAADVQ